MNISRDSQRRFDSGNPSKEKMLAKQRAADLIGEGSVLDLGGEDFYKHLFHGEVTQVNLPKDIHSYTTKKKYDNVVAMHILEHSPIPLAVLLTAYDALKPGGNLYVSVPTIGNDYFLSMPEHFTCMPKLSWRRLIERAGFDVTLEEEGVFGNYAKAFEYRFLAVKKDG